MRTVLLALALAAGPWVPRAAAQGLPECSDLDRPARRMIRRAERAERRDERVGLFRNTAWLFLRAYQVGVSPGDGATCGMYPTCSGYAVRALREEGPLFAPFMATARILSNHRDPELRRCRAGDRIYAYDPVSDNVFWRPE